MFALSHETSLSVRKPFKTHPKACELIRIAVDGWQGSRFEIRYVDRVHISVSNSSPRVFLARLSDGFMSRPEHVVFAQRENARRAERRSEVRGVSGTLDPGVAVLKVEGNNAKQGMVTLYVYDMAATDEERNTYAVARDAFQVGDLKMARQLAQAVNKRTVEVFLSLCEAEQEQLRFTIARAGANL
jgi:hypothetical protein